MFPNEILITLFQIIVGTFRMADIIKIDDARTKSTREVVAVLTSANANKTNNFVKCRLYPVGVQ